MPLTPAKYQAIKAALADNSKDFSDEMREQLQAAVEAFDNDYSKRAGVGGERFDQLAGNPLAMPRTDDAVTSVGSMPRTRSVAGAPQTAPAPDEARVQQLISQLDPSMSLPSQALALQPATNHPGGDEAAQEEWVHGDLHNPNGLVIFYEPPVDVARKKLLEQPEIFRALQLSVPPTAEGVMSIQEGDSTHQAFADYMYKQAAEAAAASGKSFYRRSKAPWLGDGKNASRLDTLRTKLNSMPSDSGQAFILGFDDTASFGAARSAIDSGLARQTPGVADEQEARRRMNAEKVGGIPDDAPMDERAAMAESGNPGSYRAGQLLGAGWGAASGLWNWILGEGAAGTALRGAVAGAARAGAAGAAEQGIREGVRAADNYAASGDTGTTLADAGKRIAGAATLPAVLGGLGGGIRGLTNQITERVAWGDRYGGSPGRVEAQGVEPKMFVGHEPPAVVTDAKMRGRTQGKGKTPLTVLAEDLNEPLGDAARAHEAATVATRDAKAAAHYSSPEGGYTLPAGNLVSRAIERLDSVTSKVKKRLKGVARPGTETPLRGILNTNIESVSLKQGKHGVPLTLEQAESYLDEPLKKGLDFKALRKKGVTRVYVTPRRYDSAHADEVIDQLGKSSDEDVLAVRDAVIEDQGKRGSGAWAKERPALAADVDEASDTASRVGAHSPRGPRRAVIRAGKSKAQGEDIPALEETAKRAGGDAPEKLRGARIAEDLTDLENYAALGGRNPLASPWSLWGLTDKAVLKGVYPAARKLERVPTGTAKAAARLSTAATREMLMDDPADEKRKERERKAADGYRERAKGAQPEKRSGSRKLVRWRRTSEANQ